MLRVIILTIVILTISSYTTMWQPAVSVGFYTAGTNFSSDNKTLYTSAPHGYYGWDIYMYQWNGSSWVDLGWLPGDIGTTEDELEPFVTYDGEHIFFQRWVPGPNYDIYVADWNGSGFYNSRPLGNQINNPHARYPSLTQDCQKLYFMGVGGKIWESTWNGSDWNDPTILPPEVNTGGDSRWNITISPDGNEIYFTGAGSWTHKLAYSKKVAGVWQQWQYCDYNINPPGDPYQNFIDSPALTYGSYTTQELYFTRGPQYTDRFTYHSLRSPIAVQPTSLGQIKANYAQ